MPLSTVLGAQSLIKPGVCTTATRPASPYTGQMIYDTTVATTLVWNGTAWIGGAGKVLQVVNAQTSTRVNTTTTTFVTTGLTATITPTSTTSKILVTVAQSGCGKEGSDAQLSLRLYRGASSILTFEAYGAATGTSASNYIGGCGCTYLDSPATTSATTYTTYQNSVSNNSLTSTQANSATSTITLMEISA